MYAIVDVTTGATVGQVELPAGYPREMAMDMLFTGPVAGFPGAVGLYSSPGGVLGFMGLYDGASAHVEVGGLVEEMSSTEFDAMGNLITDLTSPLIGQPAGVLDTYYGGILTTPYAGTLDQWINSVGLPYEMAKLGNPGGPDGSGASNF